MIQSFSKTEVKVLYGFSSRDDEGRRKDGETSAVEEKGDGATGRLAEGQRHGEGHDR